MVSLSKQYRIEVEKIDSDICKRIKAALSNGISEKNKKLHSEALSRIEEILSLFNGNFSENEKELRDAMEIRSSLESKPKSSKSSRYVDQALKEKIDEVIDKLIQEDSSSAITASVGIDRKTFIDAILDENMEIDLKKDAEQCRDEER